MRILIAVHGYPPYQSGGAERRAERTARVLAERGHQVGALVVPPPPRGASIEEERRDGVVVWRMARAAHGEAGEAGTFRETYDDPLVDGATRQSLERFRPDVVHVFGGYQVTSAPVRLARERGTPTVVSLTDYWWVCHRITLVTTHGEQCQGPDPVACARCLGELSRRHRWLRELSPAAARLFWRAGSGVRGVAVRLGIDEQRHRREHLARLLSAVDAIVVPSRFVLQKHRDLGIDPGRMVHARQGVDLDYCRLRVPSTKIRFGYFGQIKRHKGVDLLLDAWARLEGSRPRKLTLWGSASGEQSFAREVGRTVATLGDATWAGELDERGVWDALCHVDVVVVASRWPENSPNAILEAQALSLPVVGANIGGIPELVEHERNGLLFEPGSAADLARQMQRCLDEPDLIKRLGQAPIPFRSFREEIDALEALYTHVLVRHR